MMHIGGADLAAQLNARVMRSEGTEQLEILEVGCGMSLKLYVPLTMVC